MSVEFRYSLTAGGWAQCTLLVHEAQVTLRASYLSDALRSLLSAVCRVLEGISEATAAFDEEPGEYRWRLLRLGVDQVRILVVEFDDILRAKPDSAGKVLLDVTCRLRTFAGAVYDGCKRLLAEHGHAGYKELWRNHDFPDAEFEQLKCWLNDAR